MSVLSVAVDILHTEAHFYCIYTSPFPLSHISSSFFFFLPLLPYSLPFSSLFFLLSRSFSLPLPFFSIPLLLFSLLFFFLSSLSSSFLLFSVFPPFFLPSFPPSILPTPSLLPSLPPSLLQTKATSNSGSSYWSSFSLRTTAV